MSPAAHEPLLAGRTVHGPESARIWVDEQPYINFAGSSYLALQACDELRDAGRRAVELGHPWSQMRSAAYGGADPVFGEVEAEGALFFDRQTSVFMPTGYFCGPAAVAGLQSAFDVIFIDELAHFSLFDAARLSGCPTIIFRHADADALRDAVARRSPSSQRPLVLTDGVFATTGRVPPLADYAGVAAAAGGLLLVDESHAYGVLGSQGRGAAEHCGVANALHAGTLGKGFCAQGGLLPCTTEFAARVRNLPPLRGAGAGAPVSALVAAAALRVARAQPQRRSHLSAISQRLKTGLRGLGLEILATPAPITAFCVGRKSDMLALQRGLFEDGLHVIVSSYIGAGPQGMIRCATYADHSEHDIDRLLTALRQRL